jgi:outer membrane protein assembly factor BamB
VGPSPAFGGGLVYAANEYAKLVGINPTSGTVVWENTDRLPEVSSPVYYKGLVFVATTYSVLACVDATKGKLLWEYEAKAPFYSSPVIADGKLYIFDTNGKAYIFKPGNTANLIGTSDLGEKVYATPAFADGVMYVRSSGNLFAIGKQS